MLITRIELENIKSYRNVTVDFRRGTTAIHGPNGAGKTTLVEAIGFALFDHLAYNQSQFVREGEKYGRVVVHLIGSDDRPYEVERRCGAGAKWVVFDREADLRLEQRTDVLDKLHELFGIDRERPLDVLFRDALGVPQGTFTSIFLETASKRKQTFDALLQIEDYKTAADYLLDASKVYQEQIQTQKSEIQRLEIETRDLEEWRANLKSSRLEDQQKKEQNVQWTQRLAVCKEHAELLKQQRDHLNQCQSQLYQNRTIHNASQELLTNSQKQVNEARSAQQAIQESESDYERYVQATETLKQLRADEQQRNRLRQQLSSLHATLATHTANIENLKGRLQDVAVAHQRLVELLPLVEQQHQLEMRRDAMARQVTEYERLLKELQRLQQQGTKLLQQQKDIQQRIIAIEPLQSLAEQLTARVERLAMLQSRTSERSSKRLQFEEKRKQLQEKNADREKITNYLRQADDVITKIEEHRQEAEELTTLQIQHEHLSAQQHRLEGNIEGYARSRKLSAGGQCPLLHQPCLNIKQDGIISLESYFDGKLTQEHAQLASLSLQLTAVDDRISYVGKYAEGLNKLGQYIESRDAQVERIKAVTHDITRLEREVTDLGQDLEELKYLDQQIVQARSERDESEIADQRVRELEGLRAQMQHLQAQVDQGAIDLLQRQQEADELSKSEDELKDVNQQLIVLNDPRSQSKTQQNTIQKETTYQQHMQVEQQKAQEVEEQVRQLEQQLSRYADLDAHIGQQESIQQQCGASYSTYLKNIDTAKLLPERTQVYNQALQKAEHAKQALSVSEEAYQKAQEMFNEQELGELEHEINKLTGELAGLAAEMQNLQAEINECEQKIEHAELLLVNLGEVEEEKRTLEELHKMLEQFRKLIKEAAPHVLKAMMSDISIEANRIFGEIMGDRSAQLSWQNDYEIILHRQGVDRTFTQLSGGEQMSAALSVRLALLKKLSTLNLAFFDEPTQNMDELRRTNLAEQIRRVRGFDQLFVISHDDTFEQGLDSLIRLRKMDNKTAIMTEDDAMIAEEQVHVHAS
ncbi:MAG TPA: SMC family ATPase [Ktedonobacteraceae bacterium]|nr:SMC family ATPase [Ktedonobacteraceae bacterium]